MADLRSSLRVTIARDADVVAARQRGRAVAAEVGLSRPDQALLATAISELARNVVNYAGRGEALIEAVSQVGRRGVLVTVSDNGPGIDNIEAALSDGFSTGGSLGLGLPGARRIVDEFDIESKPGEGVRVRILKWA
ncbi:MAG: ATP-binding protein [Neomegalonema sp.]|nr:ATP-binding protein [Neomegalonema sp.]